MKKKIFNWLDKSLNEIKKNGDVRDIHIDEFSETELRDAEDFLIASCSILKELSLIAKKINLSGFRLDLNIELKESKEWMGRPINLKNIIESIDTYSMPEILVYKPIPNDNLSTNTMEFYRTPILFKICENVEDFNLFYEEYRNYVDIDEKECFTRWISFVYNSNLGLK